MPAPVMSARVVSIYISSLLLAAAGGCKRVVDAVIPGDCAADPTAAGCGPSSWPTTSHGANSDPWLVTHRSVITDMRPRVLVLNFQNGVTVDGARATAQRQVDAIAEGSRYHGYSDASAPPFIRYEIAKVVDLTDATPPSGWLNPSSTKLPTTATADFDVAALFTAQFTPMYGFTDAKDPTRTLSLCEAFEQGQINEVWIRDGEPGPARRAPLSLERKQSYDATETAVPGSFAPNAGGGGSGANITCGVSVRFAHLDAVRGPGCDLEVRGWEIESMWAALPSLSADARAFLNRDFDTRFGLPFDGWDTICLAGNPCVAYPTPTSARATDMNGTVWPISPFLQGCGSTEFPPNATHRGDNNNGTTTVNSRCEHFGLRDAPDGSDSYEPYTFMKAAAYEQMFPDCGGGWQIYWRQSVPGLGTHAVNADGTPMKNWWPLLFY